MAKKTSPSPDLLADLERSSEILSAEKLQHLQELASQGELTDEVLLKEIGKQGVFLVAFALAAANEPAILRAAPKSVTSKVGELEELVRTSAPALLRLSRIRTTAQGMADKVAESEGEEADIPFDDLDSVSSTIAYLDSHDQLTPIVRVAIAFTNREAFPPLTFRLADLTFLISALMSSLAEALERADRIAQSGLLDHQELKWVHKHFATMTDQLNRVKAGLEKSSLAKPEAAEANAAMHGTPASD